MGRRRVFSDEERKQRKKEYDIKYQNKRYETDQEYRNMKINVATSNYRKKQKIVNKINDNEYLV